MKNIFFIFIFISLFSQIVNSEILISEPSLNEPLEILIEGAGNDSIILINPYGESDEIFLEKGYASTYLDYAGKWAIEYGEERVEFEVLNLEREIKAGADEREEDFFWVKLIFAGFVAFVILSAAAGIWFVYFGPAHKKEAKLYGKEENGKILAFFEAGSRPLENVEVYLKNKKIMSSKRMEAFEKIEILRESLNEHAGGELRATFFESGIKMEIFGNGESVEILEGEMRGRRKLERI